MTEQYHEISENIRFFFNYGQMCTGYKIVVPCLQ